MTIKHLRELLSIYKNDDEVTLADKIIKIKGKLSTGHTHMEYINSKGCVWEGGTGVAPDGTYCGECTVFDCDKCGWDKEK